MNREVKTWEVWKCEDNLQVHIVPTDDTPGHVHDWDCPCMPRRGTEGEYIHNSYDARELGEVCAQALDKLAGALARRHHTWTTEERAAYEHAMDLLRMHYTIPEPEDKPK